MRLRGLVSRDRPRLARLIHAKARVSAGFAFHRNSQPAYAGAISFLFHFLAVGSRRSVPPRSRGRGFCHWMAQAIGVAALDAAVLHPAQRSIRDSYLFIGGDSEVARRDPFTARQSHAPNNPQCPHLCVYACIFSQLGIVRSCLQSMALSHPQRLIDRG